MDSSLVSKLHPSVHIGDSCILNALDTIANAIRKELLSDIDEGFGANRRSLTGSRLFRSLTVPHPPDSTSRPDQISAYTFSGLPTPPAMIRSISSAPGSNAGTSAASHPYPGWPLCSISRTFDPSAIAIPGFLTTRP